MSDPNGQSPVESAAQEEPHLPQSRYEVVPGAERNTASELYAFRAEIPPPPPPPPITPAQAAFEKNRALLTALAIGGVIVLAMVLVAWLVLRSGEPPAYIDLGTGNIAAAGLEGRFVARWLGAAAYELHIDPTSPQQLAGFSAVAGNPPYPLSIDLQLKDSSGVVCRRQILIPYNPQSLPDPDHPDDLQPEKSLDGDTIQNVVSADGRISEIVVDGPINCPAKLYKRLESWDFSSNFPAVADQDAWRRREQSLVSGVRRRAAESRARALIPHSAELVAPVEADDVIVSDNPSRGTVQTGSGRVFYIGRDALLAAEPGWQIFPLNIHFRCNVKATCVLTRPGASTVLQARLVN
ncbi:MAG TPA: hypothetical protein VHX20_03355 [Terracidiphilus sp.]|jgi:hypothetical protein|nr:hypothetical protein [Terracidiphilus sp.]